MNDRTHTYRRQSQKESGTKWNEERKIITLKWEKNGRLGKTLKEEFECVLWFLREPLTYFIVNKS